MSKILWGVFFVFILVLVGSAVIMRQYPDTEVGHYVSDKYAIVQKVVLDAWEKVRSSDGNGATESAVAEQEEERPTTAADINMQKQEVAEEKPAPSEPEPAPAAVTGPSAFTKDNWYAGPQLTERSLKGKVVLFYVWDSANEDCVALLPRIQDLWLSFKHKPFLVVGSHRGGRSAKVEKLIKARKLSFANYENAGAAAEPKGISRYPTLYLIDHTGKLVYRGYNDRTATEALVTAIGNVR